MDRFMKKIYQFCLSTLLIAFLSSLAQAAQASMYKWIDKDGNTHYSQQPPSDGTYERMNVQVQHPDASAPAQGGPTYSTPGSDEHNGSAAIKQSEAKGEEMRQKNCEQAKKALETYTAFRRVRDKSGNVVVLGDDERAKRIEDAKAAIQEFCQ